MSQEQEVSLSLGNYLENKQSNPESVPVNHPSTQLLVLAEDVIESTQLATSGLNKLTTAIKSWKKHIGYVYDQCQAIDRLTKSIKKPAFKEQFHVVVDGMKKECNIIQSKLEKAEREGEDMKDILKSLGEETN